MMAGMLAVLTEESWEGEEAGAWELQFRRPREEREPRRQRLS